MKLLIVSQYFWPENFKINDLVEDLTARGHEIAVLTGRPSYPDRSMFNSFDAAPDSFSEYKRARIYRVPSMARGSNLRLIMNYLSFAISASLFGAWKLRGVPFDCIFVYEPSPITVGIPGALMRRLKRAPLALWVQDLWPETLQAVGVVTSPTMLSLVEKLVRFIYGQCDLILAQSRSFIPRIAKHCDRPEHIVYFPNWAEPIDDGQPQSPALEVPAAPGVFTVMFAGNIGEAQNFPAILDAAEQLRARHDIRWIVIGDGRMSDVVAGEIERRGLQSKFSMLGRFAMDRMPSFYQHADALLVSLKPDPVLSATIPAKLQTYLATGTPVLAMMDGEGAAVVKRAQAGLVCSAGDSAALAAAVLQLAALSSAERAAMGQRGRDFSSREFDRRRQIDKLEAWLSELTVKNNVARLKRS